MIPITPTPPTIRPTLERATITVNSTPVSWFHRSITWSCVTRAKLDSWPGLSPRSSRSRASTASSAVSRGTPGFGRTAKPISRSQMSRSL